MMTEDRLAGRRYIALVRCSTKGQADTSIDDQLTLLRAFGDAHGMKSVDDIRLAGVSGSLPGARHDLEELIERKRTRDDFDTLLVQDVSRLTRSGAQHGAKIEYDLSAAGVEVTYVADNIPEGDAGELYKTILHMQSKQHAKSISYTSSRGAMSALRDGRKAHCTRPPYGINKLYLAPDGTPNHIIRLKPDGTQLMLHPQTSEIIGKFGRNEATGAPRHYIKQRDERVELIPGAAECVAVVQTIYRRHFQEGWGYVRIARALNEAGIPSATGKAWYAEAVRKILLNPIYTGLGIANRSSSAIYHERAPDAPRTVKVESAVLANRKRPPTRIRPRTDWMEKECDQLRDFLDADLQVLARQRHQRHLDAQAAGHSPKPNKDRHTQSEFFLKGVLTSRQGGYSLTGRRTGTKSSPKRYYGITKSRARTATDATLRKLVPAEPIERVILGILQMLLSRKTDLERDVRAAVARVTRRQTAPGHATDELVKERDTARRKITFALETLDDAGKDAARELIERLQARIRTIDAEIQQRTNTCAAPLDADETVARVTRIFSDMGEHLDELPRPTLRRVVAAFIPRAVVDLETRNVEIEIRLPEWALGLDEALCLDTTFPWKCGNEAHADSDYMILSSRLVWLQESRSYGVIDFASAA